MTSNPYLGAWKLKRWSAVLPDGTEALPYGASPTGLILYTADGYMSASIRGSDDARSATGKGRVLCYSGPYQIGDGFVTHRVMVASASSFIGKDQVRYATFSQNTLTLRAEASDGRHTIVWEKLPQYSGNGVSV